MNIGEENTVEAVDSDETGNSDGVTVVEQSISSTRLRQAAVVLGEMTHQTWSKH